MDSFSSQVTKTIGITLTPKQLSSFDFFEKELISWNEKFNLTAIRDSEGIRVKHFLDSLTCITIMKDFNKQSLIDIGTGAGFPGIPLKIMYPDLKLTLVESVGKKASFCLHIVQELGLENVQVCTKRAEEIGRDPAHRGKYDWAVARAVAGLPILVEYLLPLLKLNGRMLAQKGESAHAEVQASENALKFIGGKLEGISKVNLPGIVDDRYLVVIKKTVETALIYPRNVGVPAKKPL
jgi:16S rRNA (guanine527-N7)-methyltransferase